MTTDPTEAMSPEFRAHLEWEITRTLRREARLGASRPARSRRTLRTTLVLAACMAVGVGSNLASAQVREGGRRDSLLQAARAELDLASLRQELARNHLMDALKKRDVGMLSPLELSAVEAELRFAEARAGKVRLDIAEIESGSQPPRDELNAPLVGGRDFVKERTALDLAMTQRELTGTEQQLIEAERQYRAGTITSQARMEAKVNEAKAQAALAVVAERLALRREFVEKGTDASELARRLEMAQLRQDVAVAEQSLALARAGMDNARRMRAAGSVTELDALRAELRVKELELQVSQLGEQLKRMGTARDH